ncbi:hypothetical protein AAHA92_12485 [Salvia divinorum]|uniref:Uncharacterized protein n=1 Tax=Salvia divinorum TaxID=28513 RepID=A0ABD1HKF7_SALDI
MCFIGGEVNPPHCIEHLRRIEDAAPDEADSHVPGGKTTSEKDSREVHDTLQQREKEMRVGTRDTHWRKDSSFRFAHYGGSTDPSASPVVPSESSFEVTAVPQQLRSDPPQKDAQCGTTEGCSMLYDRSPGSEEGTNNSGERHDRIQGMNTNCHSTLTNKFF